MTTKERLRRAADKVRIENPSFIGDSGFRVFKLSTSSLRVWNPNDVELDQALLDHQEHVVGGRTDRDILWEILLKLGLDPCARIEHRIIGGETVYSVDNAVLIACLGTTIAVSDVELIAQGIVAWRRESARTADTTCVFRDSAFADDVSKTNMALILEQNGIATVRSL